MVLASATNVPSAAGMLRQWFVGLMPRHEDEGALSITAQRPAQRLAIVEIDRQGVRQARGHFGEAVTECGEEGMLSAARPVASIGA